MLNFATFAKIYLGSYFGKGIDHYVRLGAVAKTHIKNLLILATVLEMKPLAIGILQIKSKDYLNVPTLQWERTQP
ncbi:hypothetical protein VB735_11255 [Halotia wernerae UHCC 0503]|nr:hypothetical protein [Halotia wernerae UHCC 0503]